MKSPIYTKLQTWDNSKKDQQNPSYGHNSNDWYKSGEVGEVLESSAFKVMLSLGNVYINRHAFYIFDVSINSTV